MKNQDIKVGSVWRLKPNKNWTIRIDKIDKKHNYNLVHFTYIGAPDSKNGSIGKPASQNCSYFLNDWEPVYTIEGFEV